MTRIFLAGDCSHLNVHYTGRTMKDAGSAGGLETKLDQTMVSGSSPLTHSVADDQIHILVRQEEGGTALRIELGDKPVTLGRAEDADIQLPDSQVSKKHCQLLLIDHRVYVTDLGSTNGTMVDLLRVREKTLLPVGARLRVGNSIFIHELRSKRDIQKFQELESDLRKACDYVQALLPAPLSEGSVRTDWSFIPCSVLGGDAFGYHDLDGDHFALYLMDVCGHGVAAAMHSVSAINVLRQQSLPGIDFRRPEEVLAGLNAAFDMDRHNGMYFTLWYGVYDRRGRSLAYASAGHPPALLVDPDRKNSLALQTRSMAIGIYPGQRYLTESVSVEPGSSLYIFSDGVFEIVTRAGAEWSLSGFQDLVLQDRMPETRESVRLQQAVEKLSQKKELEDDFSLLIAEFN